MPPTSNQRRFDRTATIQPPRRPLQAATFPLSKTAGEQGRGRSSLDDRNLADSAASADVATTSRSTTSSPGGVAATVSSTSGDVTDANGVVTDPGDENGTGDLNGTNAQHLVTTGGSDTTTVLGDTRGPEASILAS